MYCNILFIRQHLYWFKLGGVICVANQLSQDIANFHLKLIAVTDKRNKAYIDELRKEGSKIIEKYQNELSNLNPFTLKKLTADLLIYPELSSIACKLLQSILPENDLWPSPIIADYLCGLILSDQTETLKQLLDNINKEDWNDYVWSVQSYLCEQLGTTKEAIGSIKKSLELNKSSLNHWFNLVRLCRKANITDSGLALHLKNIPIDVLMKKSDIALVLLVEIAKTGNFEKAEEILLSWFIESPNDCTKAVMNFHFSLTMGHDYKILPSEQVNNCISGIKFRKDNTELTKLLVKNLRTSHPSLLEYNSALANMLYKMDINQISQDGPHDYQLLERFPPYVAAFRIALELRELQSDGSDYFMSFHVPDDPDEMVNVFKEKISRITGLSKEETIAKEPYLPLIIKGKFLYENTPVKGALILLSKKEYPKHPLPDFGEELPAKVILDIYSIAHLAMTGLAFAIGKIATVFFISEETKFHIEQWLTEIGSEHYATISVSGNKLLLTTADVIEKAEDVCQIRNALELILHKCEVLSPELIDMPYELIEKREFIDNSVYSTIRLAVSKNIPWLCIDSQFLYFIAHPCLRIANTIKVLENLSVNLDFKHKKYGLYLHASQVLPYPVLFQDLELLAFADDKPAHYWLSEIIRLYPKALKSTKEAATFYAHLLYVVLLKSCLKGDFSKGLRINNPCNTGYAERVFNLCSRSCMQTDESVEAELAFAMLCHQLFIRFSGNSQMINLISAIATNFATGHFLDISRIKQHLKNMNTTEAHAGTEF